MACDLQFTQSGTISWKGKTKIYKFKANPETYGQCDFMVGFAGSAGDIVEAVDFFTNPENFKKAPRINGLQGLILTREGHIFVFENIARWILMDMPYGAIGSGSVFALGAMESGKTPKEAVKVATKFDPFTGMGTKVLTWD